MLQRMILIWDSLMNKDEYYESHSLCPKCELPISVNSPIRDLNYSDWTDIKDETIIRCKCSWHGKVHKLISKK
jgi:hypothetical protein